MPLICSLTCLPDTEIHVTAASVASNVEGRLRNGKHQNKHYQLCVMIVSNSQLGNAVTQAKGHIDNARSGYFNTIVFMQPIGDDGNWTVSSIVTNSYGRPIAMRIKNEYKRAEINEIGSAMPQRPSRLDSRQLIVYGAPGTGKSHGIENVVGTYEDTIRTTFHPDSDYSTFVGAYKPTMNASHQIEYVFRPQAFTNAYVQAWKKMAETDATNASLPEPQYLVIEEINRGNCAQIFGDLFQILDRKDDGYSKYPIDADIDLATYVATELGRLPADAQARIPSEICSGKKLQLPPNLYIWSTMNTSDQSLFPIDSAFKRRWDWKYIPIAKPNEEGWKDRKIVANGKAYDWWDFISIVNTHIAKVTKSEDKQMGYFFVKAPDDTGHITVERFANKVLFYLFNDVFKDWDLPVAIFGKNGQANEKYAFKEFFYAEKTVNHDLGDVKEEVVAAFIERQESEGKTVNAKSLASNTGNSESSANPASVPPQAQ